MRSLIHAGFASAACAGRKVCDLALPWPHSRASSPQGCHQQSLSLRHKGCRFLSPFSQNGRHLYNRSPKHNLVHIFKLLSTITNKSSQFILGEVHATIIPNLEAAGGALHSSPICPALQVGSLSKSGPGPGRDCQPWLSNHGAIWDLQPSFSCRINGGYTAAHCFMDVCSICSSDDVSYHKE